MPTTKNAYVAVNPSNSGLNAPCKPAIIVESRMYVTRAINGMYISGLLRSSLGGRNHPSWPLGPIDCLRDQGLCLQGNRTRKSLLTTYEFETLK